MNIEIRQGTQADLPAVHALVGELADYVNASAYFTATEQEYQLDFEEGFFHVIVAEDKDTGRVVGMALYDFVYSTWKGRMIYLEDFVLQPRYRRHGIGQQLWNALKERGRERGCKLLKWQIVETNTEALKFYAAQEATIEDNWLNGKIEL